MKPTNFPESNCSFGPPAGVDESQVGTLYAFRGEVSGGTHDGSAAVIVAWQPTPDEIEAIKNGSPVFLTMMNGLLPHFITTSFKEATRV